MPKIYEYTESPSIDGDELVVLSKSQTTYKTNLQRIINELVQVDVSQDIIDGIEAHETEYDHSLISNVQKTETLYFTYYGIPDRDERIVYTTINKNMIMLWDNNSSTYIRQINDSPISTPVVFPVYVNGSMVGSLSYTSGNTFDFTGNSGSLGYIDLNAGDRFEIRGPSNSIDAQIFEDITFSFKCEVE